MKSSVPMSHGAVNAQSLQATNTIPSVEYTVYVSAGLVYESDGASESYTKHYYAGPLRVASQIGSGNPNYETHPTSGGNLAQGGPVSVTAPTNGLAVLGDLNSMLANYGMSVSPTAPPTDTIAMQVVYHPTECDQFYAADLIERNRCLCDNFPDYALSKGIDCSPYTPIYWYHPDYIGNVEFVTDRTGQPYQHFYYAAFGDPMVSQHVGTGSFNSAFRFNAKEYDEETGNYYYGARYYEPKSSIWMGVDAMATSYPGMNPYNFTMGNPIMAVDPDGNDTTKFMLENSDQFVISNEVGPNQTITISKEDWSRVVKSVEIYNEFYAEKISTYSDGNVVPDRLEILINPGILGKNQDATYRMMRKQSTIISPKLYLNGWNGGSVGRIRVYSVANGINRISRGLVFYQLGNDLLLIANGINNGYLKDPNFVQLCGDRAFSNTMSIYSLYNPYMLPFVGIEVFYPGGLKQASLDMQVRENSINTIHNSPLQFKLIPTPKF